MFQHRDAEYSALATGYALNHAVQRRGTSCVRRAHQLMEVLPARRAQHGVDGRQPCRTEACLAHLLKREQQCRLPGTMSGYRWVRAMLQELFDEVEAPSADRRVQSNATVHQNVAVRSARQQRRNLLGVARSDGCMQRRRDGDGGLLAIAHHSFVDRTQIIRVTCQVLAVPSDRKGAEETNYDSKRPARPRGARLARLAEGTLGAHPARRFEASHARSTEGVAAAQKRGRPTRFREAFQAHAATKTSVAAKLQRLRELCNGLLGHLIR
mmetsp:Transcript_8894/g.23063  ORF Transcript_8894/g.23063 Transcript_8894/m.23063 type:complete len:268 (-) Transcript_8894:548-1351(-)